MELIGLSGYARSGKDEAAKVLVERFGFTRLAFADKLREFVYKQNPQVKTKVWNQDCKDAPYCGPHIREEVIRLRQVVDAYGWDELKKSEYNDEVRQLLQRTGTEAGREILGENIWVDAALTGHPEDAKIVVTDVRFPNEAKRIAELGGIVVRVTRPGNKPANMHVSETALDGWPFDVTLDNNIEGLSNWYYEVSYWYSTHKRLREAGVGGS